VAGAKQTLRFEKEDPPTDRTEAERDHDRILYTSAFQRLVGITQIAAPDTGGRLHNRLTHTLKVAQVARRTAKQLGLDADGQETAAAAALAHDLGHPPFGHLAEVELDKAAKPWGGFEGNAQSFRIVTALATGSRGFGHRGLNLTRRTLNGILKYPWLRDANDPKKNAKWGAYESEQEQFKFARTGSSPDEPSIEAAIMDWSDDVTYAVHDLEDFFRVGLIPLERLAEPRSRDREEFTDSFFDDPKIARKLRTKFTTAGLDANDIQTAIEWVFTIFAGTEPYRGSKSDRAALRSQTSYLIGEFVDAISVKGKKLSIDKTQRARVAVLKEIAWHYVVEDPSLSAIRRGQQKIIQGLHEAYLDNALNDPTFQLFPLALREDLPALSAHNDRCRLVTDFIAGLTEPMAYELYHRLTGVKPGSILDATAGAAR
jgi:dGTPase